MINIINEDDYPLNHSEQQHLINELCQICYIKYQKTKGQYMRPAHICYTCWFEHIKTNITKISYMVGADIISPFEGGDYIDIIIALNGLKVQHKLELEEWLFKKYNTFTKDIQKCPSQTCDYVFTMQKCKWIVNQDNQCPKCQIPLTVSPNITIKSILGFVYFIFLANKCPKCEIPIQRISGCPHMTCPCGHEFCWFCLKDHILRQQKLYSVHEPKQCASIFFSKIIIFLTCVLSLSCFLVGGQTIRYVMECVFNFLGYLIHSIIIDGYFLCQWLILNVYRNQPYRNLPFQRSSSNVQILALVGVNLLFFVALIFLQLFYTTLFILIIEIGIVGVGATIVYSVIYSCQTWFQFVA